MILKKFVPFLLFVALVAAGCGDDEDDAISVIESGAAADNTAGPSIEDVDDDPVEETVEPTGETETTTETEAPPDTEAEPGIGGESEAGSAESAPVPEDAPVEEAVTDAPDAIIEYAYNDPEAYFVVEYVSPELAGFPEVREGGIVLGTSDAFVVDYTNCCTDDTLYASITSVEDNAVFRIYGPDGEPLATEVMAAELVLQQGGEYWIVVGSVRGNASYTLEFGLAQNAL